MSEEAAQNNYNIYFYSTQEFLHSLFLTLKDIGTRLIVSSNLDANAQTGAKGELDRHLKIQQTQALANLMLYQQYLSQLRLQNQSNFNEQQFNEKTAAAYGAFQYYVRRSIIEQMLLLVMTQQVVPQQEKAWQNILQYVDEYRHDPVISRQQAPLLDLWTMSQENKPKKEAEDMYRSFTATSDYQAANPFASLQEAVGKFVDDFLSGLSFLGDDQQVAARSAAQSVKDDCGPRASSSSLMIKLIMGSRSGATPQQMRDNVTHHFIQESQTSQNSQVTLLRQDIYQRMVSEKNIFSLLMACANMIQAQLLGKQNTDTQKSPAFIMPFPLELKIHS